MRRLMLAAALLLSGSLGSGADQAPHMLSITPGVAKPGDILEVAGLGLDRNNVDEVYLTDHKFDMKVKVLDQQEKSIRFRVPPFAKAGRLQLLILTAGDAPKLLEQPLYVVIEESATEIGQAKKQEQDKP